MSNVIKVADHFWILEEDAVRSFLFEGNQKAMLIDTGIGTMDIRARVSELTDLPVFLVNTHSDRDHIAKNGDFKEIYMHPSEMDRYQTSLPEGCSMENVLPLWEGEILDLGIWKFEVILTPGHTPGSIMLLEREKKMLISGDSIQNGMIFMFGAGRNMSAYQHSLKKIEAISDQIDSIWPSHGSCPLKTDIIPGLIKGAHDLILGNLSEQEPPRSMPCKKYVCDVASFLYSPK